MEMSLLLFIRTTSFGCGKHLYIGYSYVYILPKYAHISEISTHTETPYTHFIRPWHTKHPLSI